MIDQESGAKEEIAVQEAARDKGPKYPWQKLILNQRDQTEIVARINTARNFRELFDDLYRAKNKGFIREVRKNDSEYPDMEFYGERIKYIPSQLKKDDLPQERRNQLKSELMRYSQTVFINRNPKTNDVYYYVPSTYLPHKESQKIQSGFSDEEQGDWKNKYRMGSGIIKALNDKKTEFGRARREQTEKGEEEIKELQEFAKWGDTDRLSELLEANQAMRAAVSITSYRDNKTKETFNGVLGISSGVLLEGKLLSIEKVSSFGNLNKLIKEFGKDEIKDISVQKDEKGSFSFTKENKPINPRLAEFLKFILLIEKLPEKREKLSEEAKSVEKAPVKEVDEEKIGKEISLEIKDFLRFYNDALLAEETKNQELRRQAGSKMDESQRIIREKLHLLGKLSPEEVENKDGRIIFTVDEDEKDKPTGVEISRARTTGEGKEEEERVYYQEIK